MQPSTQSTSTPSAQIKSEFDKLLDKPHLASIQTYVNAAPDPIAAIATFGKWIAKCGMFRCDREETGMIIAITCIEMGIGLVEFGQTFDVMHDGRLRKKALAAQVEFENRGGKVVWKEIGDSGKGFAEVELTYGGQSRAFRFTIEDAQKANLVKKGGAWETWQSEMLCARALSRGIARMCPKVYAGFESEDDTVPALVLPKSEPAEKPKAEPKVAPVAPVVEKKPEATPVAEKAPEPAKPAEPAAALTPVISEELANKVVAALGEHALAAVSWMIRPANRWLTVEQAKELNPFLFLTQMRAEKILANLAGNKSFLTAIHSKAGAQ